MGGAEASPEVTGKAWPAELAGSPAAAVIDRAIQRGRLAHSLLLHGDDLGTLSAAAEAIASRLLATGQRFTGASHPDSFALRPAGKLRQISADATRELITKVQVSAAVSDRKAAIVYEADRMNETAANIFLKTLEEPPANTTLILVSTHPYALLPTIRSRCLHFRFPTDPGSRPAPAAGWTDWLADYRALLDRAATPAETKPAVADLIFSVYGLLARFGHILDQATAVVWEQQKATLPEELEEDEQVAIETGIANGLRNRLFAEIEAATRDHARQKLLAGDASVRQTLGAAVGELERDARLLRLNLNESAALEHFLLGSLRLWARK